MERMREQRALTYALLLLAVALAITVCGVRHNAMQLEEWNNEEPRRWGDPTPEAFAARTDSQFFLAATNMPAPPPISPRPTRPTASADAPVAGRSLDVAVVVVVTGAGAGATGFGFATGSVPEGG